MNLIKHIKSLPQTEETLSDLFALMLKLDNLEEQKELNKWIRLHAMGIYTSSAYELVFKTYLWGGRHSFDDFMVAMEFRREPNARFWLPRRKVLEGKHHIATQIQEFIDDPDALYLGFSQAPGTGKSTLIKFLMAYIVGLEPRSANIYVSYSDGLTKMLYDSVVAMITDTNEYCFHEIFPEVGMPDCSAEYKTISYRKKGDFPSVGFISLGGSVTGRTRANRFLITDDLVKNKEEARSPERLAKLYDDYKATLTTRMIGDTVKQISLGTRWSIHDPIGRMQAEHANDPRYKFIAIPVKDEEGHSNFNYEHPDRYTDEKIKEIEQSLDPVDFSCLFMQKGIEKEGLAFPSDSLNYYNGTLPDGRADNILFAADIAWGGGDSFSMPIVYIYGDTAYIHDVIFDKGDKFRTKPRVIEKILHHKVKMGRFEANNGGDEYADDISRQLKDIGYSMNLTHKKAPSNMSKMSRIEQHAPNIKTFYFRDYKNRSKEYQRFMDELTTFTFTGKNLHDDAADSMAMLVDYMTGGIKSIQVFKRFF